MFLSFLCCCKEAVKQAPWCRFKLHAWWALLGRTLFSPLTLLSWQSLRKVFRAFFFSGQLVALACRSLAKRSVFGLQPCSLDNFGDTYEVLGIGLSKVPEAEVPEVPEAIEAPKVPEAPEVPELSASSFQERKIPQAHVCRFGWDALKENRCETGLHVGPSARYVPWMSIGETPQALQGLVS